MKPIAPPPTPWFALLALAAGLVLARDAHADAANSNKTMALDLFDRGVRQMREAGCERAPVRDRPTCEAARDALARAYELYPEGLGALRNLAYVEASLGLVASAARSFRELARRAPHDPSPARRLWADFARKEAEALAPRVPHLEIQLAAAAPAGLTLLLDGTPVPEAAWRTPLDLDPGPHELRAEAPGQAAFTQSFVLAEAEHERVSVALQAQSAPAPASAEAPAAPTALGTARSAHKRWGPLLVTGSGVAALGAGLGFGYKALNERNEACGDTHSCEPEGLATGQRAAHVSTALTAVGGAALTAGLVWYLVRRKRDRRAATQLAPAVAPGTALLHASGSF